MGRAECDVERQSAEALARLIEKKRKALDTFLLKVGVLFGVDWGVNCGVTGCVIGSDLHRHIF